MAKSGQIKSLQVFDLQALKKLAEKMGFEPMEPF
jgi:hypothetical protein